MTEELHPSIQALLARPTTEDEKVQEMRRASYTRANLTEAERLVSRGKTLEDTALANLSAAVRDGNEEQAQLERWHLADALAMSGDLDGAIQIHPLEVERERLIAEKEAIDRPDDEMCSCQPQRANLNGVEIEVPNTHISKMIFSPKHGDLVGLEVCACGAMNARPVTGVHAVTQSETFKGRPEALLGFRPVPDTKILKANG